LQLLPERFNRGSRRLLMVRRKLCIPFRRTSAMAELPLHFPLVDAACSHPSRQCVTPQIQGYVSIPPGQRPNQERIQKPHMIKRREHKVTSSIMPRPVDVV